MTSKSKMNLMALATAIASIITGCSSAPGADGPSDGSIVPRPKVVMQIQSHPAIFGSDDRPIVIGQDFETTAADALQYIHLCNWVAAKLRIAESVNCDELDLLDCDNLDLTYLAGQKPLIDEVSDTIKYVIDQEKLNGDRQLQKRLYDLRVKKAIFDSIPNPVAVISANWKAMLFAVAQAAFCAYMNYKNTVLTLDIQYQQIEWNLEKSQKDICKGLMIDRLENEATIIGEFGIDGRNLVGIEPFTAIIRETSLGDPQKAKDYLQNERTRDEFVYALPYWYFRGITDMECGDFEDALQAFYAYQYIHRPILKHDRMAALVAQGIASILLQLEKPDKKEIKRQLEIVAKYSRDTDWDALLFYANATFRLLGDKDSAIVALDHAISAQLRDYREQEKAYLEKLRKQRRLRTMDNGKTDNLNHIVETIPPSQDILLVLRSTKTMILAESDVKSQSAYVEKLLADSDVTPVEKLWHYAQLPQAEQGRLCDALATARLAIGEIYVDYNYCDPFDTKIPYEIVRAQPISKEFVMRCKQHDQILSDRIVKAAQNRKWVAGTLEMGQLLWGPITGVGLGICVYNLDSWFGIGRSDEAPLEEFAPEVVGKSFYTYNRKNQEQAFNTVFDADNTLSYRRDIVGFEMWLEYPGFFAKIDLRDDDGETCDIEWSDMHPYRVSIVSKEEKPSCTTFEIVRPAK